MNLPQLHYTWAPPGPGGSGFRFTAVGASVPGALLREAERLVAYEPPEGAGAFPQALSLSLLSDGSRLLARSVCTGGAAAPGLFHAHAVHLPQRGGTGPVRGALPITSWGSPQWAVRTPPGGAPPPPLAEVPAPGRHDRAALAEFVAVRGPWLAAFFADVRRLAEERGAARIVLVEPDSADVARWVMLACSVLPHQRGQWLTFTTYTRRPRLAPQGLIGVLPGDAAEVAEAEGYRVYEPGRGAAPGDPEDVWARTAARVWRAGRPELLAEVRRLPGPPYAPGPLSALAARAGVPLDEAARTAAAAWSSARSRPLAPDPAAAPGPWPPPGTPGATAPAPGPVMASRPEPAPVPGTQPPPGAQPVPAPQPPGPQASPATGPAPRREPGAGAEAHPGAEAQPGAQASPAAGAEARLEPGVPPSAGAEARPGPGQEAGAQPGAQAQHAAQSGPELWPGVEVSPAAGAEPRLEPGVPPSAGTEAPPGAGQGAGAQPGVEAQHAAQSGPELWPGVEVSPAAGSGARRGAGIPPGAGAGTPPGAGAQPGAGQRRGPGGGPPGAGVEGSAAARAGGGGSDPERRADPAAGEAELLVGQLREAGRQGADTTGQLPLAARKLAFALFADPDSAYGEQTRAGLTELPVLRALVLDRLDALAAGDPPAGVRMFARTGLRLGAAEALPHLRMCARAAAAEAVPDRVVTLDGLLHASGVSPYAEPLVLRTAMRLVWGGDPPAPDEAGLVLATTGAAVHRDAGTWELLADAAVRAPAGDPAAAHLAAELLRHFATDLPDGLRAALTSRRTPGATPRLRPESAPSTPLPGRHRREGPTAAGPSPVPDAPSGLPERPVPGDPTTPLGPDDPPSGRPPGPGAEPDSGRGAGVDPVASVVGGPLGGGASVRILFESEDARLLAAYRRAARDDRVSALLRDSPGYLAACFAVWSAHPQAGPLWQETRTELLEEVLRPVVRGLPPERLAEAERELAGLGRSRAEEFRAWQRPNLRARLRTLLTRRPTA
ncbi:GTPase-associated protein 1-related protein [Streptomyces sp. NPDC048507]|uniref:GTPase-associated protein 1-related protein n=1 Tax=Streptomyces sp. NPDC048507 TaxID=3365560 RepID=UPI00370FE828